MSFFLGSLETYDDFSICGCSDFLPIWHKKAWLPC